MKKIVFFDIDGTLLDHEKKLPSKTQEALEELKRNEVFVAISTGRAPFMFESLRRELDIDSYVSFNGQFVVFENEVIYRNPLPKDAIERLHLDTRENKHPLVFMNEHTMKSSVPHHHFIEESMKSLNFPHPETDEEFYKGRDLYQALMFCEENQEKRYFDYEEFRYIRWHPYSVDVVPVHGSKAEGIKKMIERLDFKLEDVYAFGDGLNDIEMLQAVGTGVAMGNAEEVVKKHANLITKNVDDNGIWHGLKELGLI